MKTIALLGSEEQKTRWLPAMARLEAIRAFALTEPAHGSDSVALETIARRERGDWVLDGAKRWIGNGSIADVVVVWARSDQDGRVKGFSSRRTCRASRPSRSPAWRRPARSGRPRSGSTACDAALTYSKQRTQFGRPLCSFQIVQERLVRMLAEVTSMQLYCMQLARLEEEGRLTDTIAGLAKFNNTRKARQVIAEARDMLGGKRHPAREPRGPPHGRHRGHPHLRGQRDDAGADRGRDITGIGAFA